MLNWDWFSYFALVAVLCWIAGAWSAFKKSSARMCVYGVRACGVWYIYQLVVAFTGASSSAYDGRNPFVVFVLFAFCRTDYLHKVEI